MRFLVVGTGLLTVACASGSGPVFRYAPAPEPLRYEVEARQELVIETPMGNQESFDTTRATVSIVVGAATASGWDASVSFDALEHRTRGTMAARELSGGDLVGRAMPAKLSRSGHIELVERPTVPGGLADYFDPAAFFADILAPMPENGDTKRPWPVRTEVTSLAGMKITAIYEGTAQVVGDTVWNGQPAKIITSSGTVRVSGTGTPAGAPVEISLMMTGTSDRRYVWDHMVGIMLAARTTDNGAGTMTLRGMDMTITTANVSHTIVELKR